MGKLSKIKIIKIATSPSSRYTILAKTFSIILQHLFFEQQNMSILSNIETNTYLFMLFPWFHT